MTYRHVAACPLVLAGVLGLPATLQADSPSAATLLAADGQGRPTQTPAVTIVDGRRHPESVPPEIAWEHFFVTMVMLGFDKPEDTEPRAEMVEALSKYNLFIPPTEVRTVLLVSKATMGKVEELRRPLDPEGRGQNQPGLTTADRESVLSSPSHRRSAF